MYTVNSVFTQITDSTSVFQNIMDTLRMVDPSFEDEHRQYIHSVDTLMDSLCGEDSLTVMEYIAAKEKAFCSEMIYIAWLGFQQNIFFSSFSAILGCSRSSQAAVMNSAMVMPRDSIYALTWA